MPRDNEVVCIGYNSYNSYNSYSSYKAPDSSSLSSATVRTTSNLICERPPIGKAASTVVVDIRWTWMLRMPSKKR